MDFIKNVFQKIGTGLLYGIGFCLTFFIFSYLFFYVFEKQYEDEYLPANYDENCPTLSDCEDHGLSVVVTSENISSNEFVLLGKVENEGEIKWTSVSLRAELFDASGKFIEECTEYINRSVPVKDSINFKLSCSNCSPANLESYSSYTLSISDANTY